MVVSIDNERIVWIGVVAAAAHRVDSKGDVGNVLIACLDCVFHKEAVAVDIVQHVVLQQHIVRPMNRNAAGVGIRNAAAANDVSATITSQMPVNRVASQRPSLTKFVELHAIDRNLTGTGHDHHVSANAVTGSRVKTSTIAEKVVGVVNRQTFDSNGAI